MEAMPKPAKITKPKTLTRPGKLLFVVPEVPITQKSTGWFIATSLLFAIVLAIFVWFGYYLLAVTLVTGVALFYYFGIKTPERQFCAMTEKGITFRGIRYPFEYFKHFSIWLDRFGDGGVLVFAPKEPLRPHLTLRFQGVHYAPMRLFLRHYLAEELHAPTVFDDLVARIFRV